MNLLEKAEHMYMFVLTGIMIAGALWSGLAGEPLIMRAGGVLAGIVGDYAFTWLIARGLCEQVDIDKVDYIYE